MAGGCTYAFEPTEQDVTSLDAPWSCPHDAHDDADRCVFHLTPDARERVGVTTDDVVDALRAAIETEGPEAKRFVGAELDSFDLSFRILRGVDNHPVDLRHASIGTLDVRKATVDVPLDLRHAEIDRLDVEDATFTGDVDLSDCTITGPVAATATTFDGDVDLVGTRFGDAVTFDEARFGADTCFRDTAFAGEAQFRGVEFQGDANLLDDDACFKSATFEDDVQFTKAAFRYADFVGTTFSGDATFAEATFDGDAEFAEARVVGDADFRGVEFHGDANVLIDDADFSGTTFEGDINLANAEFAVVTFDGAAVAGDLRATDATFRDDAAFTNCAVDGTADFLEARFHDDVSYEGTRVAGGVSFVGAEFHGGDNVADDDVCFRDVTFDQSLDCTAAEFGFLDCRGATVDGPATFDDAVFTDDANLASLEIRGEASFREAVFHGDTAFDDSAFAADVRFDGIESVGGDNIEDDDFSMRSCHIDGVCSFERAQFRYAVFVDVTFGDTAVFDGAQFDGDAVFTDASFNADGRFVEARFYDDVAFEATTFDADVAFDGAEFHGGANTQDDDCTFADASFSGEACFEQCQFRYADFSRAAFAGSTTFEGSTFTDDAVFSDVTFDASVSFEEVRFDDDTAFERVVFAAPATFDGVEFHGGANILDDDVTFAEATFRAGVSFERGEFGYADFRDVTFADDASFIETTFTDYARFDRITAEGTCQYDRAQFHDRTGFTEAEFASAATFDEAEFDSNVSFTRIRFGGPASFQGTALMGSDTILEDDADFRETEFTADATFAKAEFRFANFSEARFGADATFESTFFDIGASFDDCSFEGALSLSSARFEGDTSFAGCAFGGDTTFDQAEFLGGSNLHGHDTTFEAATFHAGATFDHAEFATANFEGTQFTARPSFIGAAFDAELICAIESVDGELIVDMTDVTLQAGSIQLPDAGNVFYDLSGATLRDVALIPGGGEHAMFDYFRFSNTDFDGFDFSKHMGELSHNDWAIHEFELRDRARLADGGSLDDPAVLEGTYLRAKNSADAFGHRKAAAEFFIKELTFRRQKNWQLFTGRDTPVRTRLRAGGKWFGNKVLQVTCGYGERLWRVIYASTLVIGLWALLYTFLAKGTQGSSGVASQGLDSVTQLFTHEGLVILGKNLYFSVVTFTTLGYGDVQPIGAVARTLAGLEAFFGALLVALVVFVLGRRVAW